MKNNHNHSLDFLKLFACLGVLCIHCPLPDKLCIPGATFGKIGVPFFLMISGYFLSSSEEIKTINVKRKIKHIFKIAIEAVTSFFVFRFIFEIIVKGNDLYSSFSAYFHPLMWIDFFLSNSPFYYAHLWFLFALIYCYALVMLCASKWNGKWKIYFSFIALLLFLLSSEFGRTFDIPYQIGFFIPFNFFAIRALPFFIIGSLFKEYQNKCDKFYMRIGSSKLLLLTFLCYCLSMLEAKVFHSSQFYVGTIAAAMGLFLWCLNNPDVLRGKISFLGRNLSIYIYIYHVAVFQVFRWYLNNFWSESSILFKWGLPFLTILISLTLSFIRYNVSKISKE